MLRRLFSMLTIMIGGFAAWFFGSFAMSTVPKDICDWSKDPVENLCSDYGPFYWSFCIAAVALTLLGLWLINRKKSED
jgi:hypothetical protein